MPMPTRLRRRIGRHRRSSPASMTLPHRFERQMLRDCLDRIVSLSERSRQLLDVGDLVEWLQTFGVETGIDISSIDPEDDKWHERKSWPRYSDAKLFRAVASHVKGADPVEAKNHSAVQKRLKWMSGLLDLPNGDAELLGLCVRARLYEPFKRLADIVNDSHAGSDEIGIRALAVLSGRSKAAVEDRLGPARPLMQLGLLQERGCDVAVSGVAVRVARAPTTDARRLQASLFGAKPKTELSWDEFVHLGEARDIARDVVAASLTRGQGAGILLYGEPGTGKTAFAKVLAKEVGARAIFIGEGDEDGDEPNRSDRIAHLVLAGTLAARAGSAMLVVDEADDIFTGVDAGDWNSRTGSKVFMNRLVERVTAPTIWITNAPDRLGEAIMRRMSLALRFRSPGRAVRRSIVARVAARQVIELDAEALDRVSAPAASPALLEAGLRAAALTMNDVGPADLADRALACTGALMKATGVPPARSVSTPIPFDASLSAADVDLVALESKAVAAPSRALSFLFYGLPGTGKSAFARHLA